MKIIKKLSFTLSLWDLIIYFWNTLWHRLIILDLNHFGFKSFCIVLYRFVSFWIIFKWNFDQNFVKINENHWKTKFHKILMKFEIRNIFFESHYDKLSLMNRSFGMFVIILDCFRPFSDEISIKFLWKPMKIIEKSIFTRF